MRAIRIRIFGRVQGVFFRKYTFETAQRLGISGTVRNMTDGSVEVQAKGLDDDLKTMIDWCYEGSPTASVEEVQVEEIDPKLVADQGFKISY